MSETQKKDEDAANRLFGRLLTGIVVLVLLYAALLIAVTWPISELSISAAGTFGDSFGILTSIFSGVAFAGLIWTILLQRAELKLQRQELAETRRQSILTRLMTVTQNQINSYRSEMAPLQFESIASPGDQITTVEMLFTMIAYLEQLTQKSENGEGDGSEMVQYLLTVAKSIRSYQALIQGLKRCCKSNRLLLVNESITPDEANDLKAHMFAELPAGLMHFVTHLHTALQAYNKSTTKEPLKTVDLFNPLRGLEGDCSLILAHHSHTFTVDNMASDRGQKWLFH